MVAVFPPASIIMIMIAKIHSLGPRSRLRADGAILECVRPRKLPIPWYRRKNQTESLMKTGEGLYLTQNRGFWKIICQKRSVPKK